MKEILKYIMLDASNPDDKKVFEGKYLYIEYLEHMLVKAKEICINVCFDLFFEEPNEDIITAIKIVAEGTKKIEFYVHLRDAYYQKHIGKYMDAEEELRKLVAFLSAQLDSVCWREVAGGCDGCDK